MLPSLLQLSVVTLELSEVTVVVVVVEDSSTFLSGVRPRLGDHRLGVTAVCGVTCCTGGSFDAFGDGRRRRLRAGDRDREQDLCLPGSLPRSRFSVVTQRSERSPERCVMTPKAASSRASGWRCRTGTKRSCVFLQHQTKNRQGKI